MPRRLLLFALAGALGCAGGDLESLHRLLEEDRRAHLETDADLLAEHLADTLISLADGRITVSSRDQVRSAFRSYFAGARYHAWEDEAPPLIRISPGGRMAWVARRVRVDREEPALGGGRRRRRFTGAWTATYERQDGRWRMASVASTFEPDTPGDRILAGAARAVGDSAVKHLESIRATAAAAGPRSRFQVRVTSRRSGEARLDFSGGTRAAIGRHGAWWANPGAEPERLDPARETFLRGHELHLMLLAPETRTRGLAFTGRVAFEGVPALRLTGVDALDGPVELFFRAADSLPLGFRIVDHVRGSGPVTVTVGDWVEREGVRVFRTAEFRQGPELYRYRYTGIDLNPAIGDSAFLAAGR